MIEYDAVVAGGGPAGCRTAALIAGSGCRTLVVEEHQHVGEPVQCAGLVSPRTLKTAGISRDIVLNEINGAYVHSPGGEVLAIRGKKPYALVIDRTAFDRRLAEKAQESGAELLTVTRLEEYSLDSERVLMKLKSQNRQCSAAARLLIGADGVMSQVARRTEASQADEMIRMHAAEAALQCDETDMVHIFLGREIAPGWFGWVIPVSANLARVGIGISGKDSYPGYYFKKMIEAHAGIFKGIRVIRHTGGAVPIGPPPRIYGDKTMLVGDAACQTKPISGGGLYLGLLGAELCAKVAVKALAKDCFTSYHLAEYQRLWEKKMAAEIFTALKYREIYLTMTDYEMDTLIKFLNTPFWRNTIAIYSDVDYPSWVAGRLSFAGPWTERFMLAGFKKVISYAAQVEY